MLDKGTKRFLTSARTLGGSGPVIDLSDNELIRLCALIARDEGRPDLYANHVRLEDEHSEYFQLHANWFNEGVLETADLSSLFLSLEANIKDFRDCFVCFCELHKRRRKFSAILENQSFPLIGQIVPRSLLEYGGVSAMPLASWVIWRKWLYDIDNRAAQETGYLFEPILAKAIGGIRYSDAKSPIRRATNASKGRQVDCLLERDAYEFKMRVTSAASGQGRFQEELDFARDCKASGYKPILLVLDQTLSNRLQELTLEYEKFGGTAYVGQDAWNHVEERAGPVMSRFIDKYVKTILLDVEEHRANLLPLQLSQQNDKLTIVLGEFSFSVNRRHSALAVDSLDTDDSADALVGTIADSDTA